ncbi:MAG TPA: hypothetical protein VKV74_18170 [Bryobacteraceae bacterium]|nr:hypothetical protein [Bryobacteraceae bacterium]
MSVAGQVDHRRAESPLAAGRPPAHTTVRSSAPWRVFLTCWLTYTVFWTPYIVREHFPAFTLSERGTLNVEPYLGWSDDIFQGPRGGAYINNNPGAPLAGAIPLFGLRPMLEKVRRWNEARPPALPPRESDPIWIRAVAARREFYFLAAAFVTVALVMAPATAATMAYLCLRLLQAGIAASSAAAAAILCGLATPLLYRAAYLNHNLLAADAGFVALLLAWDPKGGPSTALRAALAGLLAGYALLCDYSGVVVIAVVGAYVLLRKPAAAIAFALGVAPMVAALFVYQMWAFGSFYRPSQHFMTPTAPTSHGYRGFDWPSARLLWANFFDPRFGLFAYCPALLLAFAAPLARRGSFRIPRLETWVLFAYFGLFVLFCACNQYSWLQPSTGFRYLVPVVPGLALLAMQACQSLPSAVKWMASLAALLQSLILAAAHENSFGLSVRSLIARRFRLPWMMRLSDLGVHAPWAAPAAALGLVAAALVWVPYKRGDWRR